MSRRRRFGQRKTYIVEVAPGPATAGEGSPVIAVSYYAAPPSDGRPLLDVTATNPNDGTPTTYVSYYAAGTLQTPDGAPVHAVNVASGGGATVTLNELSISDDTWTNGTAQTVSVYGTTATSTLSLPGSPSGITINSVLRSLTYDGTIAAGSGTVTIRETLDGATNTPRDTVVGYTIAAAASSLDPSITPPILSLFTANLTYPPQIDVELDDTAIVTDTIKLEWKLGSSDFTSPTGSASNAIDAGEAAANAASFTGLSSITTGTHRFRARIERGLLYSAWSNVITQGPDDIAPTITSGNPSGTYPEITPITGTLTANETVTWSKSGTNAAAVTLNATTGAWSYTPDFETVPSPSWTFIATDAAGNTSSQVVSLTITDVAEVSFSIVPTASPDTLNTGFSGTNHTFSAQAIGTADPARHVLVLASSDQGANPAVKVGTVDATALGSVVNYQQWFVAPYPTGTTADITVVSVNPSHVNIQVFAMYGGNPVPTETPTLPYTFYEIVDQKITVNTPTGGSTLIGGRVNQTTGTGSWTNATAAYERDNLTYTYLSALRTTAGSATASLSGFSAGLLHMTAVSFEPA